MGYSRKINSVCYIFSENDLLRLCPASAEAEALEQGILYGLVKACAAAIAKVLLVFIYTCMYIDS